MNEQSIPEYGFGRKLTWTSILSSTYSIYRKHFWAFLRIGLPIALFAYLFKQFERQLVHFVYDLLVAIAGTGWERKPHIFVPLGLALAYIEGAFYWLISTCLFAAISEKILDDEQEGALLSDAYSHVRPRMKALFLFSIVTWTPFWLGRALALFAGWKLLGFLGIKPSLSLISLAVLSLPLLIVAALFSRLALAVPELMENEKMSVREALRSSLRKTKNWGPFFMFFLAKSAIAAYVIYWLAEYGFNELWNRTSITQSAYDWINWAIYILIAVMLESPLFIAFSVLYRGSSKVTQEDALARAIG